MKILGFAAAAAAGLLSAAAVAAPGHTAYSAYMQQLPAPPMQPKEAYERSRKTEINQGIAIGVDDIRPPAIFEQLQQKLGDEGVLAATSAQPAGVAGAVTDAASAQRLQAQIQAMTPAQQMAYANQMSQQMLGSMSGSISAADQATLELLSKRQADTSQRIDADIKMQTAWAQLTQHWQEEHLQLNTRQDAERSKSQPSGCSGRASNNRVRERRFADEHVALTAKHLDQGRVSHEQRRVFAVPQVGFADQLATRVKPGSHALVTQGYAEVRSAALQQIGLLAGIDEKLYAEGAKWYAVRRRLEPDDACGVGTGG
ncbi:MAG TPA: hypothetical protein VLI06_02070 [Solimonas sp.]|nr:hypothetical protein [Solimonas sp.]